MYAFRFLGWQKNVRSQELRGGGGPYNMGAVYWVWDLYKKNKCSYVLSQLSKDNVHIVLNSILTIIMIQQISTCVKIDQMPNVKHVKSIVYEL